MGDHPILTVVLAILVGGFVLDLVQGFRGP
jgi:hypothetical protein